MSHDGHKMVTPNVLTGDSTQYNFPADAIDAILRTASPFGHPDRDRDDAGSRGSTTSPTCSTHDRVIDMNTHAVIEDDQPDRQLQPVTGAITGPVARCRSRRRSSPNGRHMVTGQHCSRRDHLVTNTQTDTCRRCSAAIRDVTASNTAPSKAAGTTPMSRASSRIG
jgi:hypothetical protein